MVDKPERDRERLSMRAGYRLPCIAGDHIAAYVAADSPGGRQGRPGADPATPLQVADYVAGGCGYVPADERKPGFGSGKSLFPRIGKHRQFG